MRAGAPAGRERGRWGDDVRIGPGGANEREKAMTPFELVEMGVTSTFCKRPLGGLTA